MSEPTMSPPPEAIRVASQGPMSPGSEAPTSPVSTSDVHATANGVGISVSAEKKESSPAMTSIQAEKPNPDGSKLTTAQRQSTIKHTYSNVLPRRTPRPGYNRGASSMSGQSRYSQMTWDYFDAIPAHYNVWASLFTWILLAGFVIGPGAQQAARGANDSEKYQQIVDKVPLLVISVACSGVGALGMVGLWIRWSNNYIWLIHKIFLPGFLSGLTGTLAAMVNTWAMQNGRFRFDAAAIVSLSITGGSTVVCLALTLIYQFILLSVKREHRRMVAEPENEPEVPTLEATAAEQDFTDGEKSA